MFKKKNDGNGEKIFRYSIRKYHFGAASVAVAALMFFANGVQAQAPEVSLATASEVVAGPSGNSDGDPQESDGEDPEKVSQTEPSAELSLQGSQTLQRLKSRTLVRGRKQLTLLRPNQRRNQLLKKLLNQREKKSKTSLDLPLKRQKLNHSKAICKLCWKN